MTTVFEPLPNCVEAVLCGLSASVRSAISALLQGYVTQLNIAIVALEAKLVYLDILTIPPQALKAFVDQAIAEVKAGANLIPFSAIGQCIEVGNLNVAIQQNLDIVLSDANIISNDLSRMLSFKDEVTAEIAQLQATLNTYTQVIALINACP